MHLSWIALIGVVTLCGAGVASAETNCPPGYYATGGGTSGWHSCVPIGPIEEEPESDDAYASGDDTSGYATVTRFDPAQWAAWAQAAQQVEADREARRLRDPAYRELRPGIWDFPNDASPAPAICTAGFFTTRGGVLLMDWAGADSGSYLAFWGGGIPSAERFQEMRVTLVQSGERQSVTAFHAPSPWAHDLGMILFAVPSSQALIGSIADVQDFEVISHGQSLISGEWHSGLKAQAALRHCMARR